MDEFLYFFMKTYVGTVLFGGGGGGRGAGFIEKQEKLPDSYL